LILVFGFLLAALTAASAVYVLAPLRKTPGQPVADDGRDDDLFASRAAAVQAVRDLDDDLRHGRVSEDEYPALRERYLLEAMLALKASEDQGREDTL
jgi:hypothetical protein